MPLLSKSNSPTSDCIIYGIRNTCMYMIRQQRKGEGVGDTGRVVNVVYLQYKQDLDLQGCIRIE